MKHNKTYYQPLIYGKRGWNVPDELFSFEAFSSAQLCVRYMESCGFRVEDYVIEQYHDDDIEGVNIIDYKILDTISK